MSAVMLAGGPVSDEILRDVRVRVARLAERGVLVGLGTILVGDDPASAGYVRKKHEACAAAGLRSVQRHLTAHSGQAALLDAVAELNDAANVHAFLVQHPVPDGYDYAEAMAAIAPAKDADGLHPLNLGRLVLQQPGPLPCTPAGVLAILAHYGVPVAGREVVVVGRGPTLGRPLALMLAAKAPDANAAVTVVHSGVQQIERYTRRADVVVAAVGVPGFIRADMVKPGAAVVGGGITWDGTRLLSDVDESVGEVAGWVTPRLGGVGPTTVAMLLRNAVNAAEHAADAVRP
jgi:methylenetetrahydrofolate dehydrogenase (NADP+)/methenyltetrahydrofolate cyclohydrolase